MEITDQRVIDIELCGINKAGRFQDLAGFDHCLVVVATRHRFFRNAIFVRVAGAGAGPALYSLFPLQPTAVS